MSNHNTSPCHMQAVHAPHPWDTEDRVDLRWRCPGVSADGTGAIPLDLTPSQRITIANALSVATTDVYATITAKALEDGRVSDEQVALITTTLLSLIRDNATAALGAAQRSKAKAFTVSAVLLADALRAVTEQAD